MKYFLSVLKKRIEVKLIMLPSKIYFCKYKATIVSEILIAQKMRTGERMSELQGRSHNLQKKSI